MAAAIRKRTSRLSQERGKQSGPALAKWIREGGGVWSDSELWAISMGRHPEAYVYVAGWGPVPKAVRQAAAARLKKRMKQSDDPAAALKKRYQQLGIKAAPRRQAKDRRFRETVIYPQRLVETGDYQQFTPMVKSAQWTPPRTRVFDGRTYRLHGDVISYYKDGMVARLKEQGFSVRTLQRRELTFVYVR